MTKKNIAKTISTGSTKQRALLLAEDVARSKFNLDGLLTPQEFSQISKSFKTDREVRFYNQCVKADDSVLNAIVNLQGLSYEAKMHKANLRGYILLWGAIEEAEQMVNTALHQTKDIKERKRIAEKTTKGINFIWSKDSVDSEGYIELNVDSDKSSKSTLLQGINSIKAQAITSSNRFLGCAEATLDFMEANSFHVKTYREKIEGLIMEVKSPILPEKGFVKYQEPETFINSKRLIDLYTKGILPSELKPDPQSYEYFTEEFLK